MSYTIALAGNPNCGKTTLFNELTGSRQHVGNWPGVTVRKRVHTRRTRKSTCWTFREPIPFPRIQLRKS